MKNQEDSRTDNKMNPEQADTSINDQSPAQAFIEKIDRRDRLVRAIEVSLLMLLTIFSLFSILRLQQIVHQNDVAATQRSVQAQNDRDELKGYIRCILLIRYDAPPEQLTSREGVAKTLDGCAEQSQK